MLLFLSFGLSVLSVLAVFFFKVLNSTRSSKHSDLFFVVVALFFSFFLVFDVVVRQSA